jgi:hypothetical protein
MQAAFVKDAGSLSDKFTGLARVMSGKYDWKPGQGVRSVGDVFNLIVKENGLLAGVLSGTPNTGAPPAPITDPEKLQEALKASYLNLQKVITGLSDNDLQTTVKLFGRDWTKQQDALTCTFSNPTRASGAVDCGTRAATVWFRPGQVRAPISSVKCCVHGIGSPQRSNKSRSERKMAYE